MNSAAIHKNRDQNKKGKVWERDKISVHVMLFEELVGYTSKNLKQLNIHFVFCLIFGVGIRFRNCQHVGRSQNS